MEKIQDKLNELFDSKILTYNLNILNNTFDITVEIQEGEKKFEKEITFYGVTTFFFVNNDTKNRKKLYTAEPMDFLELTSIYFVNNQRISIAPFSTDEAWLNNYVGEGNIIIEIWNKLLILEAVSLKINEIQFLL